jgi:hypothetical protein
VLGGGCPRRCRARPELGGRGDCGMWVGRLGNAKEIREKGCIDSCGVSARER